MVSLSIHCLSGMYMYVCIDVHSIEYKPRSLYKTVAKFKVEWWCVHIPACPTVTSPQQPLTYMIFIVRVQYETYKLKYMYYSLNNVILAILSVARQSLCACVCVIELNGRRVSKQLEMLQ